MGTVKRQAGGTAVLATPDVLGVDVALPRGHRLAPEDIVETYRWLGETWVDALTALGMRTRTVSVPEARKTEPVPDALGPAIQAACFGTLSPWEVISDGRKVVGLAQVRRQKGILLQSAVHLSFDANGLAVLLLPASSQALATELRRRAVGLDELAGRRFVMNEVVDAFCQALVARYGVDLERGEWSQAELRHAEAGGPA